MDASEALFAPGAGPGGARVSAAGRRGTAALVGGLVGGLVVAQALLAGLFGWPAARSAPRDLPITVAGPPALVGPLVGGLTATRPGAFAVREVADAAAARASVTDREAYAALVVDPSGIDLLVASAASPVVAQLLGQAVPAAVRARAPDLPVRVQDLVPNPAGDSRGAVPGTVLIPVVMTSLVAGALLGFAGASRRAVLAGLAGLGLLGGPLTTGVVQGWLGALSGSYLPVAGTVALLILAAAAPTAGLTRQLGGAGAALAAVTIFFVGFPLSGATSAPELVPTPWGAVGQALPVGSGGTALRSVSFFAGAGAEASLLVLTVWVLGGLALLLPPARVRHRRRTAS